MGFQSETCEHVNLSHDLVVSPSTPKSPLSIKFPSQPRRIRSTDRLISLEKVAGRRMVQERCSERGQPSLGFLIAKSHTDGPSQAVARAPRASGERPRSLGVVPCCLSLGQDGGDSRLNGSKGHSANWPTGQEMTSLSLHWFWYSI